MKEAISIIKYILSECDKYNEEIRLTDNTILQIVEKYEFAKAMSLIKGNLMYYLQENPHRLGLNSDQVIAIAKEVPELAKKIKESAYVRRSDFTKEQLDQLK